MSYENEVWDNNRYTLLTSQLNTKLKGSDFRICGVCGQGWLINHNSWCQQPLYEIFDSAEATQFMKPFQPISHTFSQNISYAHLISTNYLLPPHFLPPLLWACQRQENCLFDIIFSFDSSTQSQLRSLFSKLLYLLQFKDWNSNLFFPSHFSFTFLRTHKKLGRKSLLLV